MDDLTFIEWLIEKFRPLKELLLYEKAYPMFIMFIGLALLMGSIFDSIYGFTARNISGICLSVLIILYGSYRFDLIESRVPRAPRGRE